MPPTLLPTLPLPDKMTLPDCHRHSSVPVTLTCFTKRIAPMPTA